MLGLCLYVPVSNSDPVEVEYFESNGLPSELKSLFNRLSVFLPSQEFSTYQRWRNVRKITEKCLFIFLVEETLSYFTNIAPFSFVRRSCLRSFRRRND